jgi:uncharacterized protein YecE (DUF72 family)
MSAASPKQKAGSAALWVGTSGYSYPEWIEAGVYPPGTKAGQMLPLYARDFPVTELNYTWYQMPRAEAIERQRALVPPDFLFCAKLTRTLTHESRRQGLAGRGRQVPPGHRAARAIAPAAGRADSIQRQL